MMMLALGIWLGGMVPIVLELAEYARETGPYPPREYALMALFVLGWPVTIWSKD